MKRKILAIFMLILIAGVIGFTIYFANRRKNAFLENQKVEEKEPGKNTTDDLEEENNGLDTNYRILDVSSSNVQDLYNKTRIRDEIQEVPDYYKNEKFTNDSIITLTLENEVNRTEKKVFAENLNDYETIYEYDMDDFSRKVQELWGNAIEYNLEDYTGAIHCEGYYYDKETKKLALRFESGCGLEEKIISDLVFAYETDSKIILIEESLYIRYVEKNNEAVGIYNNAKDKKLIQSLSENDINILMVSKENKNLLSQHKDSVTNYKYVFQKNSDETYTLSEFNRLTEDEIKEYLQ